VLRNKGGELECSELVHYNIYQLAIMLLSSKPEAKQISFSFDRAKIWQQ
jgi:hypothetical protein